jgi:dihydrofolate synthase/folylpolyglutamate synthase
MTSFGLCLEYFRRKKVDIAVIEAGVGGRNDLTNVLNTCLAVITPLGFDHIKTLGDTIESIAGHKAGIMKKNIPAVVFKGRGSDVILSTARKIGAAVKWVEPEDTGFSRKLRMQGGFQNTNARIAEKAALALQELGYHINEADISAGLAQARIPGRLEKLQGHPEVIIDGAHNYQKLKNLFSEFSGRRIIVIYGMLQSKINDEVLSLLKSVNARFIFTKPEVYGKEAFDSPTIIESFPPGEASFFPSPSDALQGAVKAGGPRAKIVVAGSLYLAGNIRESYFPAEDVLFSRTSWPNMF